MNYSLSPESILGWHTSSRAGGMPGACSMLAGRHLP
jgi:hypothetical protein